MTNLKYIIREKEIVFQGVEEEAIKLNRENDDLYKNLEIVSVENQLLNEERDKEHTANVAQQDPIPLLLKWFPTRRMME